MTIGAGIRSLAVRFPSIVRTNAYWTERYPEIVADAERRTLARLWRPDGQELAFDRAARPFLSDPFRGSVERRVCAEDEDSLSLELEAAREAISGAGLSSRDIGLLIASSFRARQIGVGNAAFLARELGLAGTAWNLETACAGTVASLQTAVGLVRAGLYENVLVVVSCTYSLDTDERDTLSWFMGDGAGALVVSSLPQGEGYLGARLVHTGDTCDAFAYRPVRDEGSGQFQMRIVSGPGTGRILRETSEPYLTTCCHGALADAGLRVEDIECFVVNTPTAWFAEFAASALGIDPARTVNTNPLYGNIGPALTTANLHYAARSGRLRPGDLVLVYAIGSVSSAGAIVMRWGDVALGADPPDAYDRPLPRPAVTR